MPEAQRWYSICMDLEALTESDDCALVSLWEDRTRADIKPRDFLFAQDRKSEVAATSGHTCRYYKTP